MDIGYVKNPLNTLKAFILANKPRAFGYAVALLWLCFAVWQGQGAWHELKPHEKGEFLTGFFAPLAFLWLALAYFKQGEELKKNTEALKQQSEDFKNHIEQHTKLLENIAAQIAAPVQPAYQLETEYEESELKADLELHHYSGGAFSDSKSTLVLNLSNYGHTAKNLHLSCGDNGKITPTEIESLSLSDYPKQISIEVDKYLSSISVTISYVDGLKKPTEKTFLIFKESDGLKISSQGDEYQLK